MTDRCTCAGCLLEREQPPWDPVPAPVPPPPSSAIQQSPPTAARVWCADCPFSTACVDAEICRNTTRVLRRLRLAGGRRWLAEAKRHAGGLR